MSAYELIFWLLLHSLVVPGTEAASLATGNKSEKQGKTKLTSKQAMQEVEKILEGYNKYIRPKDGGPPDIIDVTLFIKTISKASEVTMDLTADIYFRQEWEDPRLSFRDKNMTFEGLRIESISERLWAPDTFFQNEVSSFVHSATVPNEYFKMSDSGVLLKSTRYTLTVGCPMDLRYFPMDTQICPIIMESYGYFGLVQYRWGEGMAFSFSVNGSGEILPNFKVDGTRIIAGSLAGKNATNLVLKVGIQLSRYLGYYLIQVYWPCASLVVVSWCAFWMDDDSISERISLGVTTILTITMLSLSVSASSPKIPYVKAVDVYVGICFLFIFTALLENIVVGYMKKKVSLDDGRIPRCIRGTGCRSNCRNNLKRNAFLLDSLESQKKPLKTDSLQMTVASVGVAGRIDFLAKIVMPMAFAIVNLCYWLYYLHASKVAAPHLTSPSS